MLTLGPEGWDRKRSSRLKHEVFTSPQKEAVSDAFTEVRADGLVYPESRRAGERTFFLESEQRKVDGRLSFPEAKEGLSSGKDEFALHRYREERTHL